jgi:hypothetical protein
MKRLHHKRKGDGKQASLINEVRQGVAQVARADVYAESDNEEGGLNDEECNEEGKGVYSIDDEEIESGDFNSELATVFIQKEM